MIGSSRRVEWGKDLSFISFHSDFGILSHILPPVATYATLGMLTQNYSQFVGTYPTYHPISYLNIDTPKKYQPYPPPIKWTSKCMQW